MRESRDFENSDALRQSGANGSTRIVAARRLRDAVQKSAVTAPYQTDANRIDASEPSFALCDDDALDHISRCAHTLYGLFALFERGDAQRHRFQVTALAIYRASIGRRRARMNLREKSNINASQNARKCSRIEICPALRDSLSALLL